MCAWCWFDPILLIKGVTNRNIMVRFVISLNCIVLSSIGAFETRHCTTKWRQYCKRWHWVSPEYCTNIQLSSYLCFLLLLFANKKISVFMFIIKSIIILFISLLPVNVWIHERDRNCILKFKCYIYTGWIFV